MKYIIGAVMGAMLMATTPVMAAPQDEVWFPLIGVIKDLTTQVTNLEKEIATLKAQNEYLSAALAKKDGNRVTVPVYNAPQPSALPSGSEPTLPVVTDTTAPLVDMVSIDFIGKRNAPPVDIGAPEGFYLRIVSNEKIDVSDIKGVEVLEVTYNSHNNGVSKWKRTNNPAYYTEVRIAEPTVHRPEITISDIAGNEVTRSAQVTR